MYSAAILTGGRAIRFGGRDKGALVVEGRTIRERQLAMLSEVAEETLIIGADADLIPGCGPMGGVHAAVTAARHDAVFVMACDMPHVTAAFARHLLELAREADVVVPRTERGYHPLCAVYTRACLEPLARRLAARTLQMIALLDDVRVRVVEAGDIETFGDRHRLLANVNTPADYAGLEALQVHER
jgi:molybdenum cofactor guanylyltransferase